MTWPTISRPGKARTRRVVAAVAAGVATTDLLSKFLAVEFAGRRHLGPFTVAVTHNRGLALGLLQGDPRAAVVLDVAATAVAVWAGFRVPHRSAVAAGLVLGGALGNMVDRLNVVPSWTVVDWLQVSGYPPAFNLADLAIRGGLLAWLILSLRAARVPASAGRMSRDGD